MGPRPLLSKLSSSEGWFRSALLPSLRDRRGAIVALFAAAGMGAIGVVALATEGGLWYLTKRNAQNAADLAAYAGALRMAFAQGDLAMSPTGARTQAVNAATNTVNRNGFVAGTASGITTTVTVNVPPVAPSSYTTDSAAVQVIITRTMPRLLSGLFLRSDPTIRVSATVGNVAGGTPTCILALNGGFSGTGTSEIDAPNCVLASNATGSTAVSLAGGSIIKAAAIVSAGGCSNCNNGSAPAKTYQPTTADPYAYLQSTTYPSSCPSGSASPPAGGGGSISNPTGTLYYCSNIKLSRKADFAPGTYVFYDATLTVAGGANVICTQCSVGGPGVTFVFTGSSATSVGNLSMASSSSLNFNAPATGTYAGVAIYADAKANNSTWKWAGGSQADVIGALYLPTQTLSLAGQTNARTASECHIIVAYSISLVGGASISEPGGCGPINTSVPGSKLTLLVE